MLLNVDGMTCSHCEAAVRRAITTAAPEAEVEIDRAAGEVEITGTAVAKPVLIAAIEAEGYIVTPA